jgi:peptidoglycan lytic transglycosylase
MPALRRTASTLLAALLALGVPAVAGAQTSAPTGGVAPTERTVQSVPVTTTGGPLLPAPVDLGGRVGAVLGMPVTFAGSLSGSAGRLVLVQRQDPKAGWVTVASTVAGPDGTFTATWKLDRVGLFATRAVLSGPAAMQASANATPLVTVTSYRAAKATYFGPGLYGKHTACGLRLTRALRGIAHRTLPCGSVVELVYQGHVLRAPVVDRGPFTRGIQYDLTSATAKDLGFTTTDVVGAAQVSAPPATQRSR